MSTKQALKVEPYDGELQTYWNVMFIGDFAVITMTVEACDENEAVVLANDMFTDYYGWDLARFATQVEEV